MSVLVTGSFDIVHLGHLKLFKFIKNIFPAHEFIIAIDDDERIKQRKGDSRPINTYEDRKEFLILLNVCRSYFRISSDEDIIKICKDKYPIRVLGSDYKNLPIVGEEHCLSTVYFPRIENYSTTNIIQRLNEENIINS